MDNIAVPRPNWNGGTTADLANWYTQRFRENPNTPIPNGYSVENGVVTRDQPNWMFRNPWIWPTLGVGAGIGLGAAAGTGPLGSLGSASGAGAAATAPSEASIPTTLGVGGGGTSSALSTTMKLLSAAPSIIGLLGNRNAGGSLSSNVGQVMQAVPQLGQLLDLQLAQARRADPLHESLVTLSQRLLPNSAR